MNSVNLKRLFNRFDEKIFLQYITINNINIHEMLPKELHDPEINKSRCSDSDYNFLDLAAFYGSYLGFKYFLNKVPSLIIFKSSQNTPLIFYALKGKNDQIIKEIVSKASTKDNIFKIYDGLFYSLKLGDLNHLSSFFKLAQSQRPGDDPETILYEIFQSEEHKPKSPLKLAIKSRNIMCVAFILNISQKEIPYLIGKQGKNKKRNALTPLHVAARYGCGDISYLLISLDPKMIKKKGPNKYFYPFVDAIKYNICPSNYEEFFKHGANKQINAKDLEGNACLHYAIKHANISAVKILLNDNLIDVNNSGEEDKAPIHFAAQVCSKDILEILLKNESVDIFAKDAFNNWALHVAAESNWDEGFLMILQKMAEIKKEEYQTCPAHQNNDLLRTFSEPSTSFDEQQFKSASYMYANSLSSQNSSLFSIDTFNNNSSQLLNANSSSSIFTNYNFPSNNTLLSSADVYPSTTNNNNNITNSITRQNSDIDSENSFPSSFSSSSDIIPDTDFPQTNSANFISSADIYNHNMQSSSGEISIYGPNQNNDIDQEKQDEENDVQFLNAIRDVLLTKNKMGLCCFHIAAIKNCSRIFECLDTNYPEIAVNIYKEQSGLTGFTVLHYLAMCGHDKLLKKILEKHKTEIEIDKHGIDPIVSPLYQASKYNHDKCVQVLKSNGALIANLTKRQRDVKQYVHSAFMRTLLFGDDDTTKDIVLDAQDSFHTEINNDKKNIFEMEINNEIKDF